MRFIYDASEQFKIEPVAGYELHCRSNWMTSQRGSCLLVCYRPLGNPEAQKPAAAARTNVMVAARLGPSERYSGEPRRLRAGPDALVPTSIRPTEATIAIAHRLGAALVPAPPKTPKVRCRPFTNAPTSPIPHTQSAQAERERKLTPWVVTRAPSGAAGRRAASPRPEATPRRAPARAPPSRATRIARRRVRRRARQCGNQNMI